VLSPADPTASLDEAEDGTAVTFRQGDRTLTLYGFGTDIPEELRGSLHQAALPNGRVFTVNYNTSSSPQPAAPRNAPLSIGRDDGQERYLFDYVPSGVSLGELATMTHQIGPGDGPQDTVQLSFDYYSTDGDYGLLGDLKAVRTLVRDAQGGGWVQQQAAYYAYDSAAGQVRHVFDARQYQALLAATGKSDLGDFHAATDDATLAAYAGQSYTYRSGQVATQTLGGGRQTYAFDYYPNPSPFYADGYNNWKTRTTETLRDADGNLVHTKVVYTNYQGDLLLADLTTPDGRRRINFKQYDDNGLLLLDAQPSALVDYVQGNLVLQPAWEPDNGLVRLFDYYEATGPYLSDGAAGGVQHCLWREKLRRGANPASVVVLAEYSYRMRTANGQTVFPLAARTQYGDNPITTAYQYAWYDGSVRMSRRVTRLPAVAAWQNGSGHSAVRVEYFDADGRTVWLQDELGRVTYNQYEPLTGAVLQTIADCNATQLASAGIAPPAGLAVPADGLHAVTDATADHLGRTTQALGPQHAAVDEENNPITARTAQWTLYDDAGGRVIRAQGYQVVGSGDVVVVNPLPITLSDAYGRATDEIAVATTVTSRPPLVSDSFPDQTAWRRWTHSQYRDTEADGSLQATLEYCDIPSSGPGVEGTNYAQTDYGYDWKGRQNRVQSPGGTITRMVSDDSDNIVALYVGTNDAGATDADPTGGDATGNDMVCVKRNVYHHPDGLLTDQVQHVDGNPDHDRVTHLAYDWRDRLASQLDPNGGVTSYSYDNLDNRRTLTDPDQNTTTWFRDPLGRVWKETNQAEANRSYSYDLAGKLLAKTDRNGRITTLEYDSLGRKMAENWCDGSIVVHSLIYAYDLAGNMTSASDSNASYTYVYDPLGRVVSTTGQIAGLTPTIVLTAQYNDAGNLVPLAAAIDGTADFVNNYQYDNLGRRTQATQSSATGGNAVASKQVDLAYNADGRFSVIDRYADLAGDDRVATSRYAYDGLGRLATLTHAQGSTSLAAYMWQYNLADDLTQEVSTDGAANYAYDPAGQLTAATYSGGQADESYSYDANGNLANTGYVTGTDNELLSDGTFNYTYDAEGNRTSRTRISTAAADDYTASYAWDHRNRLTSVTFTNASGSVTGTVTQTYDAFNRWIGETATANGTTTQTRYVYDGNQIILHFDGTGTGNLPATELSHRYLWGPAVDQLLADEQLQGATRVIWPLGDRLNTLRDLSYYSSGATSVANHRVFSAFGEIMSQTNPQASQAATVHCLLAYTGRPLDVASGLQNNLNRWYDDGTGRWISEDPIAFHAGDGNLYRYVRNSPMISVDPTGEATIDSKCVRTQAQACMTAASISDGSFLQCSVACSAAAMADSVVQDVLDKLVPGRPFTPNVDYQHCMDRCVCQAVASGFFRDPLSQMRLLGAVACIEVMVLLKCVKR
jgi:RHS repeat-associated protein